MDSQGLVGIQVLCLLWKMLGCVGTKLGQYCKMLRKWLGHLCFGGLRFSKLSGGVLRYCLRSCWGCVWEKCVSEPIEHLLLNVECRTIDWNLYQLTGTFQLENINVRRSLRLSRTSPPCRPGGLQAPGVEDLIEIMKNHQIQAELAACGDSFPTAMGF